MLEAAVGGWGAKFVSVGLIISVLGAYLAWTLMAAEVLFVAARDRDMPRFLKRTNRAGAPTSALLITTVLTQVMLFVSLASDNAFDFMLNLTSAASLIPFLLAAGYALKLVITRDTYLERPAGRGRDLTVAVIATLYTVFLLYAAGPKYMLMSLIIYAPGSILFAMARREQRRKIFSAPETAILLVSIVGAFVGVLALAAGWITV